MACGYLMVRSSSAYIQPGKKPQVQKSASRYSYLPASGPVCGTVCGYCFSGAFGVSVLVRILDGVVYSFLESSMSYLEDLCKDIVGVDRIQVFALCAEMVNGGATT